MAHEEVTVSLTPTWVRLAVVRHGHVERLEREPVDPSKWATAWAEGLRPLDAALNAVVTRMGLRSRGVASVVYVGPESHVDVCSVPAVGHAAHRAAELALHEVVRDSSARLNMVRTLSVDRASKAAGRDEPAKTHVQIVSENAVHAEHMGGWLRRAGLEVAALTPLKSLLLSATVAEAETMPAEGSQAVLWLDDHATALAARTHGRLQFVRTIDIGYAQLADAIVKGATACGLSMDRGRAYAMLFAVGVPRRGQTIDAASGLKAEAVLPMMQSILQRYVVEAKQTLRFGLPEGELARATVRLAGPGALIPGLLDMFSGSLDWTVEAAESVESASEREQWGEVVLASRAGERSAALLPQGEVLARLDRRLNRAVMAGLALGAVVLGAWTFRTSQALARADARIEGLRSKTEAMQLREELNTLAVDTASELVGATRLATQTLGQHADLEAALAALTRLTPESVDLAEVTIGYTGDAKGAPVLTLRGVAWPAEAGKEPQSDPLSEFIDRLSRSPVIESARIVSTRTEMSGGTDVKQFTISGVLRALPPSIPQANGGAR